MATELLSRIESPPKAEAENSSHRDSTTTDVIGHHTLFNNSPGRQRRGRGRSGIGRGRGRGRSRGGGRGRGTPSPNSKSLLDRMDLPMESREEGERKSLMERIGNTGGSGRGNDATRTATDNDAYTNIRDGELQIHEDASSIGSKHVARHKRVSSANYHGSPATTTGSSSHNQTPRDLNNTVASRIPQTITFSITHETFVDHFLPLAQRIADIRIEEEKEKDSAHPNEKLSRAGDSKETKTFESSTTTTTSDVITPELLTRFSQRLTELSKDLRVHHHQQQQQLEQQQQDSQTRSELSPTTLEKAAARIPLANLHVDEDASVPGLSLNGRRPAKVIQDIDDAYNDDSPVPGLTLNGPRHSESGAPHPSSSTSIPPPKSPENQQSPRRRSSYNLPVSPNDYYHHRHDTNRQPPSPKFQGTTSADFAHSSMRRKRSRDDDVGDYGERDYVKRRRRADEFGSSVSPLRRRKRDSLSGNEDRRRSPSPVRNRERVPSHHQRRSRSRSPPERTHHRLAEKPNPEPRSSIPDTGMEPTSTHVQTRQQVADTTSAASVHHRHHSESTLSLSEFLEKYRGTESTTATRIIFSDVDRVGIWLAFRGSSEVGMSTIEFEIEEPAKWIFRCTRDQTNSDATVPSHLDQGQSQISLELSCFALEDIQMTLQNLGTSADSDDRLEKALSSLKKTWPPQGHLIISLNEKPNQKYWFPDVITQNDSSIRLEDFVRKGVNLVKFIQLSDLSENIFVLLATVKRMEKQTFLLPIKGSGADTHSGVSFPQVVPELAKV